MSATARSTGAKTARTRDQGRVLFVTDEEATAAYCAALENAGINVVGVTGGAAALVAMRKARPHVVIADVNLKGISAEELGRMLAQTDDAIPLVLIGDKDASRVQRSAAFAAGAFDYFQVPADLSLLVTRTTQLIKLRQTIDRLRSEADCDYLTGLANRRRFRVAIGQEVERWRRYRVPCALLLIDIDYLKRINDAHGHPSGDAVIRHVASALQEHSRDNDTAARLGGEEFALLLASTNDAQALAAAERLRHSVSATQIEKVGTVTVSLGVAACPTHAVSERELYGASDAALYRAKQEGRDRTVVATVNKPPQQQ